MDAVKRVEAGLFVPDIYAVSWASAWLLLKKLACQVRWHGFVHDVVHEKSLKMKTAA